MIVNTPFYFIASVMEGVRLNGWALLDIFTAQDGELPDFTKIKSPDQKISPRRLHEMFRGTKSHALVSTQFLCALNFFLDSDRQISKDAITAFYHNLLMQALNKLYYEVGLDFTRTSEIIKSKNNNLQGIIYDHKKEKQKLELENNKMFDKDSAFPVEKFELDQKTEQEQIHENKKEEVKDYLETAMEFYSEDKKCA